MLLEISGLFMHYDNQALFEGLSLQMQEGEIVALLGPNGCGKTTLLDCVIGYRQYEKGLIRLSGADAKKLSVKEKARQIAYVPQGASHIFPFTVTQMVLMGRTPYLKSTASPSKKDYEIAFEAMETLGIEKFKERVFGSLSDGEKQLVLIARALAQDSKIILLDEPTSSLDIKNEIMVLAKIKKLVGIKNKSLLMATHQPNHVFFLEQGNIPVKAAMFAGKKIKYFGSPEKAVNEKTIQEVYNVNCNIVEYKNSLKTIIVEED